MKRPGNHRVKPGGYVRAETRATLTKGRDPSDMKKPLVAFGAYHVFWERGLDMTWWCGPCLKEDRKRNAEQQQAYQAFLDLHEAVYEYKKTRDDKRGHYNPNDESRRRREKQFQ